MEKAPTSGRLKSGMRALQRIRHSCQDYASRNDIVLDTLCVAVDTSSYDQLFPSSGPSLDFRAIDIMEAASARYATRDRFGGFGEPAQTPLQRYIRRSFGKMIGRK